MCYEDLTAGIEHFAHDLIVVTLQGEPELNQEKSAREPHLSSPGNPPDAGSIGGPDLLTQQEFRKLIPLLQQDAKLVEGSVLPVQFPVESRSGRKMGEQEVRCGDCSAHSLAVQTFQRLDGLCQRPGSVIHVRKQVAVQVGNGKRGFGSLAHDPSLRQALRQPQSFRLFRLPLVM